MIDLSSVTPAVRKARVEIIPLIDVVFFLLATFVLFTLSLNHLGALETALPNGGIPSPIDTVLHIRVDAKSLFSCREGAGPERAISPSELKSVLQEYRSRVSPAQVMISGGKETSFGATVDALDLVHAEGIKQVALETVP